MFHREGLWRRVRFSLERLGRISVSISLTRPLILMGLLIDLMCWLYDVFSLFVDGDDCISGCYFMTTAMYLSKEG